MVQKVVAATKSKYLVKELSKGVRVLSEKTLASPVLFNVKTHKPSGQVVFRVIHSCSAYPFVSLAWWVVQQIRPALSQYKHMVGDTSQLIAVLKTVNLEPGDMLLDRSVLTI